MTTVDTPDVWTNRASIESGPWSMEASTHKYSASCFILFRTTGTAGVTIFLHCFSLACAQQVLYYRAVSSGRPTSEGLKSLSGISSPPLPSGSSCSARAAIPPSPCEVWTQLSQLFSRFTFHIIFIGPKSMANRVSEYLSRTASPTN